MKKQQGVALVIVLVLLAISVMLGLSGVQSALIDEKVAGNYRAFTQAKNNAESGAAILYSKLDGKERVSGGVSRFDSGTDWAYLRSFSGKNNKSCLSSSYNDKSACYVEIGGEPYIVAVGTVFDGAGNIIAESPPVFVKLVNGGKSGVSDILVGCEGVSVSNGGKIVGGSVKSIIPGSQIRLTGGTFVEGEVISAGGIFTQGSSGAGGGLFSRGNISIDSAATYGGPFVTTGNVAFGNSAKVEGEVSADGDVDFSNAARVGSVKSGGKVSFYNSSAYVEGGVNAEGGVENKSGYRGKPIGDFAGGDVTSESHVSNADYLSEKISPKGGSAGCDIKEIGRVIDDFDMPSNGDITIGNYPLVNGTITPDGIQAFDETWKADVTLAESSQEKVPDFNGLVPVVRTGDLTLTNGELNVSGGDVVLFVDGDLTLGSGGGSGLTIADGSTLTVYVTGSTNMLSSTQMSQLPMMTNGRPTFSLFSSKKDFSDYDKGVKIDGSAKALASIYAPFANVSVEAGGGLKGNVRGKTVSVSGGAGIEYHQSDDQTGSGKSVSLEIAEWR